MRIEQTVEVTTDADHEDAVQALIAMTLDDYVHAIGLPSSGAIRASLGLVSNFRDVQRFVEFATEFVDLTRIPGDLPPRITC